MTTTNTTVPPTSSTMETWPASLPDRVMWIPYFAIGCLFAIVLAVSFRRHHLRHLKKKQYAMEYHEKNLSARRPRISGKIIFNQDATVSDISSTAYAFSDHSKTEETTRSEHSYRSLNVDDMLFSVDSELPRNVVHGGVKKRFKSAHDITDANPFYRQISEDEYFRRKGPRESLYLKSGKDRPFVPNRNRQRVGDFDMMARSFWIQSDDHTRGQVDTLGSGGGVKYIKVFNLDLCTDCRMHVERVDVSTSSLSSFHNSVNGGVLPPDEKHCIHSQSAANLLQTLPPIPDVAPEISIAEVHRTQLPVALVVDMKPSRTAVNNGLSSHDSQHLSPIHCERPRSAPDLLRGEHHPAFNLNVKTRSEECLACPLGEADEMNSRL